MDADITFENFLEHKVKTNETLDCLAKKQGITWQQLAQFNWGTSQPKQINECLHEFVGCKHKTKNGKNYFFTSKDSPGFVNIPVKSPHYKLETGKTHRIQVIRPHLKSDIEVETVDDFLHAVGNITLVLKRQEGGPDVEITSDENGYCLAEGVLSGHYKVTVKGGGPAYFLKKTNQPQNDDPNADVGDFEEAVIDTRHKVEAITQLVVARIATTVQKRERRLLQRVYTRTKAKDPKAGAGKNMGRGTETSSNSPGYLRLRRTLAVDNLALIAGWTDGAIDIKKLVSSVLPDFFTGRDRAPANRDYYVWVIEPFGCPPRISLYNSSGMLETSFDLPKPVRGLFGVYSTFNDTNGQTFVDMMTKTYSFVLEGREHEVVPLQEVVRPADQQRFMDFENIHAARSEKPVVCLLPTLGQLAFIGLHGGSGRLEDYGNQESVNDGIHERNKIVCKRISFLYNGYIAGYVERVKKTRNEKELRKLGPPWPPYVMPTPGNASYEQKMDIYSAYDVRQLRAWKAIVVQLNKFANHGKGRLSEGCPFLSIKTKYEIGIKLEGTEGALIRLAEGTTSHSEPIPNAIEVEGSLTFEFTDEQVQVLEKDEEKSVASWEGEGVLRGKHRKFGVEYKKNLKKPDEWEVKIKTGPLALEAGKDGKSKIAIEALPEIWAESEFNPLQAKFEGGLKIETGVIVDIMKKLPVKNKYVNRIFEKYGEKIIPKEISIHAGMVGLRQETVLALITNAPGFFERRDLDELVETQWNALDLDEQIHLSQLGWTQNSWNLKSYVGCELPKTMEEEWNKFTAQQQIALVHLGFYDVEDYHDRIEEVSHKIDGWKDAVEKQCAKGEGNDSEKKKGDESAAEED